MRMLVEAMREKFSGSAVVHDLLATDAVQLLTRSLLRKKHAIAIVEGSEDLPQSFVVLVDEIIDVPLHDAQVIIDTAKLLGRKSLRLPQGFRSHPSAELMCRAIAAGLATRRLKQILMRSSVLSSISHDPAVPVLEACVEFGEARDWGLDVVSDYRGWKDGSVSAEDIDAALLLISPRGMARPFSRKFWRRHWMPN
ncbi:hypothetical protein [Devosia aurantiaca]|uniref:hypothetical protein n=1 Tax=Devosia aurantiaca TaxID=2714858 RepID=UPI001F28915A|nr:hypothetical protein [Devosia aurantiaca]